MPGSYNFTPPPPNDLPPVAVPPALNKGSGTRSISDRLKFWRALALLVLALWAVPYMVWKALDTGFPMADVLWWGMGAGVVLLIGIIWVALTFVQDMEQFRHTRQFWGIALGELWQNGAVQRAALQGHTDRWGGKRQPKEEATWRKMPEGGQVKMTDSQYQTYLATQQAEAARVEVATVTRSLSELDAKIEAILSASKARVADDLSGPYSSSQDDQDTRELPESGPIAAEYYGGPVHRIVTMALRRESISVAALVPKWMTRAQADAARAQLAGAGVLVKAGQGLALAPDLDGLGEDTCHTRVVARLTAASPPPPQAAR